MKIQTLSAVIGNQACDGGCPFCVAGMTGFDQLPPKCPIDKLGFQKSMRWAEIGECTTCLLTGKGEPTLYPDEVTSYLQMLQDEFEAGRGFPALELQTNALRISKLAYLWGTAGEWDDMEQFCESLTPFAESCNQPKTEWSVGWAWEPTYREAVQLQTLLRHMMQWKELGLDYLAVSVVDTDEENNRKIYLHHRKDPYLPLGQTIKFIHALGLRVRLCVMMHKGMVDSPKELERVIAWSKLHKVEQLTARPIRKPSGTVKIDGADPIIQYTTENGLGFNRELQIHEWIATMIESGRAKKLMTLMHGKNAAHVYDVEGQNFCLADCLTIESDSDDIRTLIFHRSGDITYDWAFRGAILR